VQGLTSIVIKIIIVIIIIVMSIKIIMLNRMIAIMLIKNQRERMFTQEQH